MKLQTTARAAVAALFTGACQLAHAHAYPVHQAPSVGAAAPTSQKDVALDFDAALEPAFSLIAVIAVTEAKGQAVASGNAEVDASNKKHMPVGLNAPTPGVYTVAWMAVAADGHRTQGHYTFTVK